MGVYDEVTPWPLSEPDPAAQRNVLGEPLEPCSSDPMTGFYRDGSCTCGPTDPGVHAVCAVMTEEFLDPPGLGRQRPDDAAARVAVPGSAPG